MAVSPPKVDQTRDDQTASSAGGAPAAWFHKRMPLWAAGLVAIAPVAALAAWHWLHGADSTPKRWASEKKTPCPVLIRSRRRRSRRQRNASTGTPRPSRRVRSTGVVRTSPSTRPPRLRTHPRPFVTSATRDRLRRSASWKRIRRRKAGPGRTCKTRSMTQRRRSGNAIPSASSGCWWPTSRRASTGGPAIGWSGLASSSNRSTSPSPAIRWRRRTTRR